MIEAELALSPAGHLYLDVLDLDVLGENEQCAEFDTIKARFDKSAAHGLLHLGLSESTSPLPQSFLFWQAFSRKFITCVCKMAQDAAKPIDIAVPDEIELQEVISQAFLMKGIEYLSPEVLSGIWKSLTEALNQELQDFSGSLQDFLKLYNPTWNLVGRVCFHLAENKADAERPFAFLATYTTQLSKNSNVQHLPLKRALQDYAGVSNQSALLALLLPVQVTASKSDFIKDLVDSGKVFQATTWTAREAHCFLKEIPLMESSGIMVRVPNWWSSEKPPRPKVVVTVGERPNSVLGLNTLLDFDMRVALGNGQELSHEEWQALLHSENSLVKIKEQWVEVDREKLKAVLSQWNVVQKAALNGLSMTEALRLVAGASSHVVTRDEQAASEWSTVKAGSWLKTVLDKLKNPQTVQEKAVDTILKQHLQAALRPYQLDGVKWLWLLYQLKLGGCLADDMGLGKTIQLLSLLLLIKHHAAEPKKPHLLIVPASLIGNWQAEIIRFCPTLNVFIAHSSLNDPKALSLGTPESLNSADVVITTYGFVHRLSWLQEMEWDLCVLDEAQLIKNPGTKQTIAVKAIKSQVRLTLTGTPVENRLGDLWSLFDFTSPGLLGSSKVFSSYAKNAAKSGHQARFVSSLRQLTQPYILRRLKTDKKIITDLPDKTEMHAFCSLSSEQVHLYSQALQELTLALKEATGIKRRGLVLSYILRFKQICNHPAQWLGYGDYAEKASGKFVRLREICEEIAAKQEKVLVFTQFREIIPAISSFLTLIFGREGLELHGETPVSKRAELVARFQEEQGPSHFVLSLKAGGTGLNLTRASHVIHFDRWWNPAVENQATDRAYRIGQKQPVMVHKFKCLGTIEDKIDDLITSKKVQAEEILEGGSEIALTELTDEELLDIVSLDIQRALGEF